MLPPIKKIALLTSGGDAPGMNACIRAIVRTALYHQLEVVGIKRGYAGLIDGDFEIMQARSVSNIIHRGSTILRSARSPRFRTEAGMQQAYENLVAQHIDALIVVGGDGSFRGAKEFSTKYQIPVMGIPGTIDNDMTGTDFTIGYDTALNTVIEAIDKIRDTAHSHDRLFFIEVMGRDAGFIAMHSGLAVGAEAILIPETKTDIEELVQNLEAGWKRQKSSSIVVVAEGDEAGNAFEIAEQVKAALSQKYEIRVTVLGHIQRGGSPTCADRVLASRLGAASVEALLAGKSNQMVGVINHQIAYTPLEEATKEHLDVQQNEDLLRLVDILAY